jgi:hypothetical protein
MHPRVLARQGLVAPTQHANGNVNFCTEGSMLTCHSLCRARVWWISTQCSTDRGPAPLGVPCRAGLPRPLSISGRNNSAKACARRDTTRPFAPMAIASLITVKRIRASIKRTRFTASSLFLAFRLPLLGSYSRSQSEASFTSIFHHSSARPVSASAARDRASNPDFRMLRSCSRGRK